MKIALLSPLWKKVPPEKYGGTELVVANLAKGLAMLGHETVLFACAGSRPAGESVEVIPDQMYKLAGGFRWDAVMPYEFLSYYELGRRAGRFDIIHNHMGLHPVALAPFCQAPFVTTLHSSLPPDFGYLAERFAGENFISISMAQRKLAPELNYIACVYHGIDVEAFTPGFKPGSYLLFVGTLSYNKGIDIAVRTAKALGMPLVIAGEMRESEKAFLDKEVFPLVDGQEIKFIGEVSHAEKAKLYTGAKALLFPSRWTEAFGLVMTEALACGTPVVALDNGSPAEIIRGGKTGFVVETESDFLQAVKDVPMLSRWDCRKEAESRFSLKEMAGNYLKAYKDLVAGNK